MSKVHRSTRLLPLELRVANQLERAFTKSQLSGHRYLIACSGGADSVALAYVLAQLARRLGFGLSVAYVHHGSVGDKLLKRYRDEAQKFVESLAKKLALPFYTNAVGTGKSSLVSEQALREFRYQNLHSWLEMDAFTHLLLAHHADDLFETRLIRLIRGTGPQGLCAMKVHDGLILRPFLEESAKSLRTYLDRRAQCWLEDPSNGELAPLRNWVRNSWLRQLEERRPGSSVAFARSLEQISRQVSDDAAATVLIKSSGMLIGEAQDLAIRRDVFHTQDLESRRRILANYLRSRGVRNFTARHVEELCKRLDTRQKVLSFSLLKRKWLINAERISCLSI